MPTTDRRRALGALGERLAAKHLERAGYTIIDRNFRTRYGELDLVARDPQALVFCEVKTLITGGLRGPPAALDAIGPRKRKQVRMMARQWLASGRGSGRGAAELRFDAVGVTFDASGRLVSVEHLEGAF
jgi:putative endonuclease